MWLYSRIDSVDVKYTFVDLHAFIYERRKYSSLNTMLAFFKLNSLFVCVMFTFV